jgi:hypothetical protein
VSTDGRSAAWMRGGSDRRRGWRSARRVVGAPTGGAPEGYSAASGLSASAVKS